MPGDASPEAAGPPGAVLQAEVRDALAGLAARLDREHERAAHREAVIDRLHEENQRLRRGELQAMLEPVRAALYRLHDQARRESSRLADPGLADPPGPEQTAQLLQAVADDVADALARLGVERFTVEPGAPYDASRHRPVAVTPVGDRMRDGTVTAVQSDGFEQSGKVLRKAAVSVGRLDDAADEDAANKGVGDEDAGDKADDAPGTGANGAGRPAGDGSNRLRGAARGATMNSGQANSAKTSSGKTNSALGTDR
ncbi:nucleotide exchange factor GrpE [Actinomadura sp. 7K534]|uniref:nucleotide exchange factor GrpE n=1 Tax=Actinomadura sp. 7K534 TaxID=2530366 RepID=UPI0010434E86|nr:nucleotide exchange factor GrpE [Actinomadura sp. 7K534]TDB99109.1 nucleotide exchange factor GrpE [Actinomadura sp. 7K534]